MYRLQESESLLRQTMVNLRECDKKNLQRYVCFLFFFSFFLSPWETVGSRKHKIRGDQDSSADMGSSELQRQLPRPMTYFSYGATNDPGRGLLPTTIWTTMQGTMQKKERETKLLSACSFILDECRKKYIVCASVAAAVLLDLHRSHNVLCYQGHLTKHLGYNLRTL